MASINSNGIDEIDLNIKKNHFQQERQRSSDIGISSKHRRLQHSQEKQAQFESTQNVQTSNPLVDFTKDANLVAGASGVTVFSDPD